MKKLTTYQKLKNKNLKLLSDIRILVKEKGSLRALETELQYRVIFDLDDAVWHGTSSLFNKTPQMPVNILTKSQNDKKYKWNPKK
jgi:hypothetical protein